MYVLAGPSIPPISRAAIYETGNADELRRDDVSTNVRKDLSPDILASSIPVAVTSHNERLNSQLGNKGLLLRSSNHNISGIRGYSLFALPILSSELEDILRTAQGDLRSRDGRASTLLYHVNTTKWAFSVITSNTSVQYTFIESIIQRFLKLSLPTSAPNDIVSTRVGVLFNESTPIADINISPCQIEKKTPFSPLPIYDHDQNLSATKPVEILKITPAGSTCAYELLNETNVLEPFQKDNHGEDKLRVRQIEGEALAVIGRAAFAMSANLWRRRDGLPVEVKIWALKAIVQVAYWQFIAGTVLTTLELGMSGSDELSRYFFSMDGGLDTGLYVVGHLVARLVVKVVKTAIGIFTLDTWKEVFALFLMPLQEMGNDDTGWAMHGVIFAPEKSKQNSSGDTANDTLSYERRVIAQWQIWMGDYDDLDY